MKNEREILTIFMLGLIIFTGCKKESKVSSFNNYIRYDDKTYEISHGILENRGRGGVDEAYNIGLTLFSSGITPIESGGEVTGASGNGHVIYFEMFTNSSSQLDNGTYEYDDSWSEDAGTFDYGWILINYNATAENAEIDQDIEGGTVTVSKTGDTYEIIISCTDEDGKSVSGYYKGSLNYFDIDIEITFDNHVKYDDNTYPISQGMLENWGQGDIDEAYNIDLTLFSGGFALLESGGQLIDVTGNGHIIYFEMFTNSSSQLDNGTYEYDSWSEDAGTFDYGWILINYDAITENSEIDQNIEGGTVTVSKTGDTYEIIISCTDEVGKNITGYYKGTLEYYDYAKKKSTRIDKRRLKF